MATGKTSTTDFTQTEGVKLPVSLNDFASENGVQVEYTDGTIVLTTPEGQELYFVGADTACTQGISVEMENGVVVDVQELVNLIEGTTTLTEITAPNPSQSTLVFLEPGQDYIFNYNPMDVADVAEGNGYVVMTFQNGGQILFNNYDAIRESGVETSFYINGQDAMGDEAFISYLSGSVADELAMDFGLTPEALNDIDTAAGEPAEEMDLAGVKVETVTETVEVTETAQATTVSEVIEEEIAYNEEEPSGEDLAAIEPAAGDTGPQGAGGNGFNSSVDNVDILQINAIGPLGPTALNFGGPQGDEEQPGPDLLNPAAPVLNPPLVSALDKQVYEDGSVAAEITARPNLTDGSEQISITISNIPAGVGVDTSTSGGTYNPATGTWTLDLAPGQTFSGGPTFSQVADGDADINNLVVTVTSTQVATGDTEVTSTTFDILVDAVADAPNFTVNDVTGDEDTDIPLDIAASVNDTDGSESLVIVIRGVPSGGSLSAGTYNSTLGGYVLTPAELTGLTFTPPQHLSGIVTMTVDAIVTDSPVDGEITLTNNELTVSDTLAVNINPIADVPTLDVQNAQVFEDGSVALQIDARLTDNDSSENLTVRVEGIPAGWVVDTSVSGGTYNPATGVWEIQMAAGQNFIGGPTVYPTPDSDVDALLSVSATSTEIADLSETQTVTLPLTVTVDAVVDQPTLTAQDVTGAENDTIDLFINTAATDVDGSESITEVRLSGFPTGTTLSAGTYNAGTDTWTLDVSDLTGLQATLPNNSVGSYTITVAVDVVDNQNDAEITLSNNQTTRTTTFGLNANDDGGPSIVNPGDGSVDETNGAPVPGPGPVPAPTPLVVNGQINVDFGNDGPGTITVNNTFNPTGSLLGGALTSQGDAITVSVVGNSYVGTTNGGANTIFTMEINAATGAFTFTLYDQIDHADALDPNDIVTFGFGFDATDNDGDVVSGTTTINVIDDAPSAQNDVITSNNNTGTVTGNVMDNDDLGFDTPGEIIEISFQGVDTAVPATGTVSIVGDYGTLTIAADGSYTYVLDPNRTSGGTDSFQYTVRDYDGDVATALLNANIGDTDDFPVITLPPVQVVDETNPMTVGGNITVDFGNDGPGTITESGDFDTSLPPAATLTSNGVPISVSVVGGQYVGTAGGQTIFTMNVNNNGSYSFNLLGQIDHQNPSDPNDSVDLRFGFRVTDADGDSTVGTAVIRVFDDGPVAVNDTVTVAEGAAVNGNVVTNDDVGFDDNGSAVTSVSFNGTSYAVPASGTVSINGTYGTLVISATGAYSYTQSGNLTSDQVDTFTYTLTDGDGDTDTATLNLNIDASDDNPDITNTGNTSIDESGAHTVTGTVVADFGNDGPGSFTETGSFTASNGTPTSNGDTISVALVGGQYVGTAGGRTIFTMQINSNGTFTFTQLDQIDHPNAGNPNDFIDLNFGVRATDADGDTDTDTVRIRVFDDGPVAVNDSVNIAEGATVNGNVVSNDDVGYDDASAAVTSVSFGGTSYAVPASGTVSINGTYGTLVISATGAYSYTQSGNLTSDQVDTFTYTLTDGDGDTDTATLNLNIDASDDNPDITNTGNTSIDESGAHTVTGTVVADFGNDGPGSFTETGSFTASNGTPTSNGDTISVALVGGQYVGTAGGRTIFTMQINSNGTFTFTQLDQIDHPNAGNPNDFIDLNFGVRATDADGDTDTDTVRIRVFDDGPVAVNDSVNIAEGATVNGNVVSNDDVGYDDASSVVTQVQFGGSTVAVPLSGTATIVGTYGTLTISSTGAYSYTQTGNLVSDQVDTFTYTLRDGDGDTDTATLSLNIDATDDNPDITSTGGTRVVDESGTFTTTGTVTADFGNDGPGSFTETGVFTSSLANLTSDGQPISVSLVGGQYVGTAGGRNIFTLQINSNGSYTFNLLDQIDHPNASNPNDFIDLRFGVRATDSDGDTDTDTITIRVRDDGPTAVNDTDHLSASETVETGNVMNNDDTGYDDAGAAITRIQFGGNSYNVPSTGTVSVNGNYGTLVISATGAYTYTRSSNAAGNDAFTYTLTDGDGDTDTAQLNITLAQTYVPVTNVQGNIGDAQFYEDGGVFQALPITASFDGGDGNETFTLRVEGIPSGWSVNAPGWTYVNGGYELQADGNTGSVSINNFRVRPPQNDSDADASNILLTVTVNDPDAPNQSDTDTGVAIVDAVADPASIDYDLHSIGGPQQVLWQSVPITGGFPALPVGHGIVYTPYIGQVLNVGLTDTDGSEEITEIVVTFTSVFKLELNGGTAVDLPVPAGETVTYANGMVVPAHFVTQYTFSSLAEFNAATFNNGFGPMHVDVEVTTQEVNLSGQEITLANNTYVTTDELDMTVGNISLSPLVLDLDGDGVELYDIDETVTFFDLDGDGVLEATGWVAPDDGLLAFDRNGDGVINDGTELFGDQGGAFGHGFAALATMDSNADDVIDANDAEFENLLVWRDLNGDGISGEGELMTLSDLGIISISLEADDTGYADGMNYISHTATFTFADGTEHSIVDAWFTAISIYEESAPELYAEYTAALEDALSDDVGADELAEMIELGAANNMDDLDLSEGDIIDFSDLVAANDDGGAYNGDSGSSESAHVDLSVNADQLIVTDQQNQDVI